MANRLHQAVRPLASAYQDPWWDTAPGQRVLADLHNFCGAQKNMFSEDSHQTAHNLGAHRVWLRIQQYKRMSPEAIERMITNTED